MVVERKDLRQIQRWAYKRYSQLRKTLSSYLSHLITQVLGLPERISVPPKYVPKLLQILRGEKRVRVPPIYQQILSQRPWLARKWAAVLRERLGRPEVRQAYERLLREIDVLQARYEMWRRVAETPVDVLAQLVRFTFGVPYKDERVANCVLTSYGLPALGSAVMEGRLCMPGRIAVAVLRALAQRDPRLPVYVVWWHRDCVQPDDAVYVYRVSARPERPEQKRPPKAYPTARCMKVLGDRRGVFTASEIVSVLAHVLPDIASAPYVCLWVPQWYAPRIPPECKRL